MDQQWYDQELAKRKLQIQYLRLEKDHLEAKRDLFNIIVSRVIAKSQLRHRQQLEDDDSENNETTTPANQRALQAANMSEVTVHLQTATLIPNIVNHSIIPIQHSCEQVNSVDNISSICVRSDIESLDKPMCNAAPIEPISVIFECHPQIQNVELDDSYTATLNILLSNSTNHSPNLSDVSEPDQCKTKSQRGVLLVLSTLQRNRNTAECQSYTTQTSNQIGQSPHRYKRSLFILIRIVFPYHRRVNLLMRHNQQSRVYDPGIL